MSVSKASSSKPSSSSMKSAESSKPSSSAKGSSSALKSNSSSAAKASTGSQAKATQAKSGAQSTAAKSYGKDQFNAASATGSGQKATKAGAPGGVNPNGRAVDAANGTEAAARLKNKDNYLTAEWEKQRAQDYLNTVEAHKNDSAYMKDMYKELGSELTSKLLGDSVNAVSSDNRNKYPTEADARRAFENVNQSLKVMPESFQREVGQLAGKNNPEAAILLKNGGSKASKLGFLDGVKGAATSNTYDAGFAARMAGEVIATDQKLLQHVADTWGASDVTKLLKNGLQTPPIGDSFHSDWETFRPDGLERMVGMTGDLKGDQYADFRARVFRDASLALDKSRAGDPNRQSLVDNLETLFKSDAHGITGRLFNNTGLADSPYDTTQKALGLFFRDSLFGKPDANDPFNQFVSDFMGDLRGKMLDPTRKDTNPSTPSNELYAKQLGDVLGSIVTGYSLAARQNGERQKAREALVGTMVGLAAKPLSGGGPLGDLAKDQAKKIATNILSDFLNGDLKADKKGMTELMKTLLDTASQGARGFDEQHGTNVENSLKSETMWVDFVRQLFER